MVLQSWSDRRGDKSQGVGMQANYSHSTKRSTQSAQFEQRPRLCHGHGVLHAGRVYQWMGLRRLQHRSDKTKYPWVHRISPFTFLQRGGTIGLQRGDELTSVTGVRFRLHATGILPYQRGLRQEPWAGMHTRSGVCGRSDPCSCSGGCRPMRRSRTAPQSITIPTNPYAGRDRSLGVGAHTPADRPVHRGSLVHPRSLSSRGRRPSRV